MRPAVCRLRADLRLTNGKWKVGSGDIVGFAAVRLHSFRCCSTGPFFLPYGTAILAICPQVRNALLAALDGVCGEVPAEQRNALLLRLLRAANGALDKPSSGLGGGGGGAAAAAVGASGKSSGDAALMVLSLAAVAVRHMDPNRGGLAMAALGGRLAAHGDLRVREVRQIYVRQMV